MKTHISVKVISCVMSCIFFLHTLGYTAELGENTLAQFHNVSAIENQILLDPVLLKLQGTHREVTDPQVEQHDNRSATSSYADAAHESTNRAFGKNKKGLFQLFISAIRHVIAVCVIVIFPVVTPASKSYAQTPFVETPAAISTGYSFKLTFTMDWTHRSNRTAEIKKQLVALAASSLLSYAYMQEFSDNPSLRNVVLFNVTSSAVISGIGAINNPDQKILNNMVIGSFAGLVDVGGKQLMLHAIEEKSPLLGFSSRGMLALSNSVRHNLFLGERPLDQISYDLGPLLMQYEQGKLRFGLIPESAAIMAYNFARGNTLDFSKSMLLGGIPVFINDNRNRAIGNVIMVTRPDTSGTELTLTPYEVIDTRMSGNAESGGEGMVLVGSSLLDNITITVPLSQKEKDAIHQNTDATLYHEFIHTTQYMKGGMYGFWFDDWIHDRTSLPGWIKTYYLVDALERMGVATVYSLVSNQWDHDDLLWEKEPNVWDIHYGNAINQRRLPFDNQHINRNALLTGLTLFACLSPDQVTHTNSYRVPSLDLDLASLTPSSREMSYEDEILFPQNDGFLFSA